MSALQAIPDIKVPYAVEGVIRTAQLDDTVAPENSVQLAVNMNFDRVGAIQTRPGVTNYADTLAEAINSFGTLRNSIVPPGYQDIFPLGDTAEMVGTEFRDPAAVKISDTKIVVFWKGVDGDGFAQNFAIDIDTGAITALGTPLEFDTTNASNNVAIYIANNSIQDIVLNCWSGSGNDGFVQAFNCIGDSVVALSSALEFDTSNGENFGLAKIDSNHVICFYTSSSSDGVATVFAVDLGGSGGVTQPGSPLTFNSGNTFNNSAVAVGDGTHFINVWSDGSGIGLGGKAQTFSVNTGTWAITAIGSAFTFDTLGGDASIYAVGDGTHFITLYQSGVLSGHFASQCLVMNAGTFAITSAGATADLGFSGNDLTGAALDGYHIVAFYSRNIGFGYVQMLELNPSTFDMSLVGETLSGYDFANGTYTTALNISANKVMVVWGNVDSLIGQGQMFQTFGAVVNGRWLYAGHGDEVSNVPAGSTTWTSRRSGLASVSKPRFAQYLNYIWMVNGNQQIQGDPVATSSGGNFGTEMVPEDFPPGDYISAGFEGRVWVANKTLGVIYYTDIVQFVPPATYTLSYNPTVNFISTISPQTGQQITALFEVPRALLVFTEDTITRIYGATSLDAYPAYNVGTYSQESIIQTKTGIFFHHSSGFYQFDYGSQPVEISRRIIDFVKAIPRTYYDDITGVWDGLDNVEWNVGPVTVEGVVFANCYLRFTISTQVWTIYDYAFTTTANIYYDDGTTLNHLVGTSTGLTGQLDVGDTDFTLSFYFEFIDRWRSYTDMYYKTKNISGVSIYSENAAGTNVSYQKQKSGPNAWIPIGTVTEENNALMPNSSTEDFDVIRWRLAGNTSGPRVVVHGIEITQLTIKGQEEN